MWNMRLCWKVVGGAGGRLCPAVGAGCGCGLVVQLVLSSHSWHYLHTLRRGAAPRPHPSSTRAPLSPLVSRISPARNTQHARNTTCSQLGFLHRLSLNQAFWMAACWLLVEI